MDTPLCRDLGIDTQHPDWREINHAIIVHYGNLVRLLMHWLRPNREVMAIAALSDGSFWAATAEVVKRGED